MAIIKTDQFIRELCRQTGELNYLNYDEILGYLLMGIRDLSIYAIPCYKIKELTLTDYKAVDWPADCVKPIAIGLCRNGRIVTLSIDVSIVPGTAMAHDGMKNECHAKDIGDADKEINDFCCGYGDYLYWDSPVWPWGFSGLGEWYGYRGGYNCIGYVNHDKKSRQSHIKGRLKSGDAVMMIYKSDGLEDCPDFIPSETVMPLRRFVMGEYYMVRNPRLAELNSVKYREEFTRLRKFYQDEGKDAWIDAMNSNVKSSPK